MKRKILFASLILVSGISVLFTSCKDDEDTTPPSVTINGASSVTISLNSTYTDQGATATDDEDGTVAVVTDNPVNKDLAGTYTVTYRATDAAGNTGTATRTVIVKNDADYLNGTYTVTEQPGALVYTQTVTASSSINNQIGFSRFGDFDNNTNIVATVTGSTVSISTQTATAIGSSGCDHTFSPDGAGAPIVETSGHYGFSIKFTDTRLAGAGSCTATSPISYEDFFVQQ